jgi:hypothetical protein
MPFVSEAIQLMKSNNFRDAAKLMESHLNDVGLRAGAQIEMMIWIADCYSKAEDMEAAAKWSEEAGRATLACKEMARFDKLKGAKERFDAAMGYYKAINDRPGIMRMAAFKERLRAYSASA